MKKLILPIVVVMFIVLVLIDPFKQRSSNPVTTSTEAEDLKEVVDNNESVVNMANPASVHCEENGGTIETITNSDGAQFSMCQFEDYACEEWTFFREECDLDSDAQKIKEALIAKGLDLSESKVVIDRHLGKYISGGVIPVSGFAGGGYVFALKEGDEIKIIADGNGSIMCNSIENYPDYPTYLIPECIDEAGKIVIR